MKNKLKLLIKFPTRNRPNKFISVYNMYMDLAYNTNDIQFFINCDNDDSTMNKQEIMAFISLNIKNTTIDFSNNKTKIEACNNMGNYKKDFDIIMLISDDMIPKIQGYDDIIRNDMIKYFPDTDGALWYNDGYQANQLNTLPIFGKKYYQRFKYIYYPKYKSLYCDQEMTEVGLKLKKIQYINNIIIKHEHPAAGYPNDELYKTNEKYINEDYKIFINRRSQNYELFT